MNLDKLVAVSGISGIFKVAANRNNGLIIEDLDTGKCKFVSARKHQFTPLESISIYTDTDSKELSKIFASMLEQYEDNPPVSPKASKNDLLEYFADIMPDYDRDRVYPSDMKKILKWFNFLHERDLLKEDDSNTEEKEETTEE